MFHLERHWRLRTGQDGIKETGDDMIRLPSDKPRHTYRPAHTVKSWKGYPEELLDFGCCPECEKMGRSPRQAFLADDLYHDFAKSELFAKYPPDLLIAFNSGHAESEVQRWRRTLKCILDLGVPAVFTTYNKSEAIGEGKIFDGMGPHFSRRPAENPWRGVLAQLENFMERYDVYYSNYYWYIFKGRTRG